MGTNFADIYCLNQVIKSDTRLQNMSINEYYFICYKYLQFAISRFVWDCKKDLLNNTPYSQTKYNFTGNGIDNIFQLDSLTLPTSEFYITQTIAGCTMQVTDYTYDSANNTIMFSRVPSLGTDIDIVAYNIGSFNETLSIMEQTILAEAMNIPYLEGFKNNINDLRFTVYGGSMKMHSQAEHLKVLKDDVQNAYATVDGLISDYSYRSDEHDLLGLGGGYNAYAQFYKK